MSNAVTAQRSNHLAPVVDSYLGFEQLYVAIYSFIFIHVPQRTKRSEMTRSHFKYVLHFSLKTQSLGKRFRSTYWNVDYEGYFYDTKEQRVYFSRCESLLTPISTSIWPWLPSNAKVRWTLKVTCWYVTGTGTSPLICVLTTLIKTFKVKNYCSSQWCLQSLG